MQVLVYNRLNVHIHTEIHPHIKMTANQPLCSTASENELLLWTSNSSNCYSKMQRQ